MNKKERRLLSLDHCDVIKVFMMLCVMFYHCICLWSRDGWFNQPPSSPSTVLAFLCAWFNSFHIYVFTFVSGYLFCYLKYEKNRYTSFAKDTLHRSKRLLVPYVFASLLWVIPFYIYFYSTKPIDVIRRFALAEAPSQLWFLVMIFVVFVLFYLFSDLFYRINAVVGAGICIAIYIISFFGGMLLPNVFQIFTAGKYIFFYYMGFAFRKYRDNILYRIPWICYFVIHTVLLAFLFFFVSTRDGTVFKLASVALNPIISTFGVLSVVIGMSKFNFERLRKSKIFQVLNKHNFVMYLLHQQIIYVVISLLNARVATPILVIANLVLSFFVSLIMAVLISKIPIVKKAFGYK